MPADDRHVPLAERMRPTDLRPPLRPGPSPGQGQAPDPAHRVRPARLAHLLGPARLGQDDPGHDAGPPFRPALHLLQRRPLRHQGGQGGHGPGGEPQAALRQADDHLHRRDPPVQQGPAGGVPAVCREGDIILFGSTTENPSFEVIAPLLSRTKVLVLQRLVGGGAVADPRRRPGRRASAAWGGSVSSLDAGSPRGCSSTSPTATPGGP